MKHSNVKHRDFPILQLSSRTLQHKHSSTFFQSQGKQKEIAALERPQQRCGKAVSTPPIAAAFPLPSLDQWPNFRFCWQEWLLKMNNLRLEAALEVDSGTILSYYFVSSS